MILIIYVQKLQIILKVNVQNLMNQDQRGREITTIVNYNAFLMNMSQIKYRFESQKDLKFKSLLDSSNFSKFSTTKFSNLIAKLKEPLCYSLS